MRVLYWVEFFSPYIGGTQIVASYLLPALRARGHHIALITSSGSLGLAAVDEYAGMPLYRFPFQDVLADGRPEAILRLRRDVADRLSSFKPELIHLALTGRSPLFLPGRAALLSARVIVSMHFVIRDDLIAPDTVAHNVIERAAWTAAISHGALEPVLRNVPGIADRSSVIYNGCPPPSLDPAPLPFAPPRMLCVGRLVHRKGFHHALNALALLLPRFPRVEMIIAGDGPDGPDLRRQAAALGIDRQVTFTGWIAPERIFDLMNGVTAVLMPSLPEGLGNVAIQAALMSRPVIGSRVAGLTEIVVPDETGLLVEPENDEALTAAMAWLIEHHADAIRMGETARLRAADVFGWSKCVDAYAELYERVGRADRN